MLLFDLIACQSSQGTMNHGGKEYGEAVFCELMRREIPLSGIYNPENEVNGVFLDYCKKHGQLIDVRNTSIQEVIDSGYYSAFYSSDPYPLHYINWGKTIFIGNVHGLRPVEAFTDKYECKYSNNLKSYIKAIVKSISAVERYKKQNFLKQIEKLLLNPSFVCITGSEHSKYTMLNYYPQVSSDRIHVFYDPLNIENAIDNNTQEKYYLLVSGNRWLKNSYRGIIALDQLISSGQISSKVIVTGTVPNMRYMGEIKNKDFFVFKDYVSSQELANLYKNAYCLIFLSLSEGFGYPPLEAISRGTPVICTPYTSLYEVYQNSVLYCNPLSIEDIKVRILEMEDPQIYNRYKIRGEEYGMKMISKQKEELPRLVDFIISYC